MISIRSKSIPDINADDSALDLAVKSCIRALAYKGLKLVLRIFKVDDISGLHIVTHLGNFRLVYETALDLRELCRATDKSFKFPALSMFGVEL